jgi:hypothetical protein
VQPFHYLPDYLLLPYRVAIRLALLPTSNDLQ